MLKTKLSIFTALLCIVVLLSACGSPAQGGIASGNPAERITYSEDEMPKNSPENQMYVEKYMYPFCVTGLFGCNFDSENTAELDGRLKSIFNAFYLYDYPNSDLRLTDEDTEVPGDVFEETLMAHLNLTPEEIRLACAEYYNAEKHVYTAAFGLGGGPAEYIITGSSLENGILHLSYDSYGGDYDTVSEEFRWLLYQRGQLQIAIEGDNYKFISNALEKGPGIE